MNAMFRKSIVLLSLVSVAFLAKAQESGEELFYIGASYGSSIAMGDFKDTDLSNADAGFADNGNKIDLYGGRFISDKVTITGTARYQQFDTQIEDLVNEYKAANPDAVFNASTEDWKVYSLLIGASYQVDITEKIKVYPRAALGPIFVTNPGLEVSSPNTTVTNNFSRNSETGAGVVYELGFGLRKDLGKNFSLMPTFTYSAGGAKIKDVETTTDNAMATGDYEPNIQSINLGLSLAYRFYK